MPDTCNCPHCSLSPHLNVRLVSSVLCPAHPRALDLLAGADPALPHPLVPVLLLPHVPLPLLHVIFVKLRVIARDLLIQLL